MSELYNLRMSDSDEKTQINVAVLKTEKPKFVGAAKASGQSLRSWVATAMREKYRRESLHEKHGAPLV